MRDTKNLKSEVFLIQKALPGSSSTSKRQDDDRIYFLTKKTIGLGYPNRLKIRKLFFSDFVGYYLDIQS
jgi:hypothetical protein